jgi:hypothetical protein
MLKTMISSYKIAKIILLALMVPLFGFAQSTLPQSEIIDSDTSADSYINVSNSKVVAEDENNITISFDIENRGKRPQFDLRYGVEIIKKEGAEGQESQFIIDTYVSPDVVVSEAGQSVVKSIFYPKNTLPPGTYEVWTLVQTSSGATLGLGLAGTVSIVNSSAVELVSQTCELTVEGESGKTYNLYQGVDISATEKLMLNCKVINHGDNEVSANPSFEMFRRNIFGEKIEVPYIPQEPLTLPAGEESSVNIEVPKASIPQAYDAVLTLENELGENISNKLVIHYVLQGQSATIQTVDFSKNVYAAGEPINLLLTWSGSADSFEDARSAGTNTGVVLASYEVTSKDGQVCVNETGISLKSFAETLSSTSLVDCLKPTASIKLVSSEGRVLDSRDIEVRVEEELPQIADEAKTDMVENNNHIYLVVALLAVIIIIAIIVMTRRKKVDFIDAGKMIVVLAFATSGFFGLGVERAEAISWIHYWSNSSGPKEHRVTFNTDRTVYSPGETIVGTYQIRNNLCTNSSTPAHNFTGTLNGVVTTISYRTSNAGTLNGTANFTAPTTPGTYNIALRMQVLGYVSTRNVSITVVAPVPSAPTSISAVCSTPGNPTSISWTPVSGATYYAFRISSASGSEVVTDLPGTSYNSFIPVLDTNYSTWVHGCNASGCSAGVASTNFMCETVVPPPPPPTPGASVSATGCEILAGNSTCNGLATWNITNAVGVANLHNTDTSTTYYTSANGVNQPISLRYGTNPISARDGGSVLASTNVLVGCESGSSWNGSVCEVAPPVPYTPVINIEVNREIIRSGETVDVTVDVTAEYRTECTIFGLNSNPFVFVHDGSPATPAYSGTFTSKPLTSKQLISMECAPSPANGAPSNSGSVRVDVVPVLQEI